MCDQIYHVHRHNDDDTCASEIVTKSFSSERQKCSCLTPLISNHHEIVMKSPLSEGRKCSSLILLTVDERRAHGYGIWYPPLSSLSSSSSLSLSASSSLSASASSSLSASASAKLASGWIIQHQHYQRGHLSGIWYPPLPSLWSVSPSKLSPTVPRSCPEKFKINTTEKI